MTEPAVSRPRMREVGMSVGSRITREHPTLLLTLVYLGLTFVGLIHDLWFYSFFKVNILDYSETSDFLLAAIRNPAVIILCMLPLGLMYFLQRYAETKKQRSPRFAEFERKFGHTFIYSLAFRVLIYTAFVAVYAILFTQIYSFWEWYRIRAGTAGRQISFMRTDGVISDERPVLLGTTGKWIFLYYRSRKATEIVPIDNVTVITVDSRRRKEREADSLKRADSAVIREAPQDSDTTSENPL